VRAFQIKCALAIHQDVYAARTNKDVAAPGLGREFHLVTQAVTSAAANRNAKELALVFSRDEGFDLLPCRRRQEHEILMSFTNAIREAAGGRSCRERYGRRGGLRRHKRFHREQPIPVTESVQLFHAVPRPGALSHDLLAKKRIHFQFHVVTDSAMFAPILIADDESEDRFFLQKALRKAGVKNPILEFRDGAELLEFFERETVEHKTLREIADVLFLDIKMPLVDGFDTMRFIRGNPVLKLLQIVIVSSSGLPNDQQRAAELGAVGYLEKYPTSETLARVVANCHGGNPSGASPQPDNV
jgi:CheY-like chemotaxis protein